MTALTVLQACRTVQLTRGANALVDEASYASVSSMYWQLTTTKGKRYASNSHNGRQPSTVSMNRYLLGSPLGMDVDHRNGDSLDNRLSNLRVCTRAQNSRNKRRVAGASKYKGVTKHCRRGSPIRWAACINCDGTTYRLGTYATEAEAARAYDAKAVEVHGEFAATNAQIYGEVV